MCIRDRVKVSELRDILPSTSVEKPSRHTNGSYEEAQGTKKPKHVTKQAIHPSVYVAAEYVAVESRHHRESSTPPVANRPRKQAKSKPRPSLKFNDTLPREGREKGNLRGKLQSTSIYSTRLSHNRRPTYPPVPSPIRHSTRCCRSPNSSFSLRLRNQSYRAVRRLTF